MIWHEAFTITTILLNFSKFGNITLKDFGFSDFIGIFAMSDEGLLDFYCNTKLSESFDMAISNQRIVALDIIQDIICSVAELKIYIYG